MALSLVERAHSRTLALALDEQGQINLPPAAPATADDQALVRALATLYLASQLELAGLVPAVETLTGVAMSGGITVDLGPAAKLLHDYWLGRNQRFHPAERRAFFARLFGVEIANDVSPGPVPVNAGFDDRMITLCESLYKLDERTYNVQYGSPPAQASMRSAALAVADNLLHRGPGIAVFAAKEIVATIQQCIQILQQSTVQRAFSEQSVWGVVRAVLGRYARSQPDVDTFVRRGKAGLVVLSWLADTLPSLASGFSLVVPLNHPVISAAQDWLESSLAVREGAATAAV